MNTKRKIISEVEQMAVNAIVHQPDDKAAAEKHFSETAKKIVETALQAVDIMDVGDVCRRAVTGASIQDYDLLAKPLTDKDFDHERLAKAIEALASERPIDYPPTYFTPGWLGEIAKWLAAKGTASGQQQGKPTEAELHEAATEEPTTGATGVSPVGVTTLQPGADGTPAAAGKAPNYLDFCRMRMQAFGGKGIETKFIGKRTNLDPTNPVQIFEITVKRPNGTFGSVATATENGELLFRLESQARFSITNTMSVKCLRALLLCREKDNRKRYRLSKRKRAAAAKAAASGEVA